jgi:GAF domain-containing protein
MKLLDGLEEPNWNLLELAREQLEESETRDAVIQVIRTTARLVFKADGVCFVLREGQLCHYAEEDAIGPLWKGQRFPLSACISGWSMLHGETAVIEDVFEDPRIPHDAYRRTFVKSLIMTPIMILAGQNADGPVAALGAYWQTKRKFGEREISAVKTMGQMIGRTLAEIL